MARYEKKVSFGRRRLIAALKRIQREAGLLDAQVAEAAGFSPSKLSRIYNFEVMLTGDDTRTFCEALVVDKPIADALVEAARQSRRAKQRFWWLGYPQDVLGRFADYMELETDSRVLRNFQVDLVPGLLQTASYAEAVIRQGYPNEAEESIDARAKLRIDRQERMLHRLELWFVIDEAALRRPLGGPQVMAEQLDHLIFLAREPGITVQILPTDISGHMALGVPFALLELTDGTWYAYLDTLSGGLYVEDEDEVRGYRDAWERLSATALDFDRSVGLIRRYAQQHRSVSHDNHLAEVKL